MLRQRIVFPAAAISGGALVLGLLTGVPASRADELADLRANSELLRQRLDQIEGQADDSKGSGDQARGVDRPDAAFPRSFAVPGTGTSVRVGGSISEVFSYRPR